MDEHDSKQELETPTIVVVAYNRPEPLKRLLHSLLKAHYSNQQNIPIVISVDGGGSNWNQIKDLIDRFEWPFGEKEIIFHAQNLGLIEHIFSCGDLTADHGSIILLEDDLMVGAGFYTYAQQAIAHAKTEPNVAGISLSALWFHGFTQLPFTPYPDDGDNFFAQVAWYQGQVYTAEQWQQFRAWLNPSNVKVRPEDGMHLMFSQFPDTDWFPIKTKYLVETGRFYMFPRESLAVNFGEMGTHFAEQTSFFQVPLQERKTSWRFQTLVECLAVYDSWQEMLPDRLKRVAPELEAYDFAVDVYGERDPERVTADYLLTTQSVSKSEKSWGLVMRPAEANLFHQIEGAGIRLARPNDVETSFLKKLVATWKQVQYFGRYRSFSKRQQLKLWMGQKLAKRRY